eukprot:TRINITY_DN574_c0_g1_i1.p1 TRINITY_DN574_c0_g1~~TRINITY_DN574_c0_g1_i1.p1  ORF type:complete len:520 (+),score=61.46 TRINITY_DN574_c0_g1_i1:352-1911(+)
MWQRGGKTATNSSSRLSQIYRSSRDTHYSTMFATARPSSFVSLIVPNPCGQPWHPCSQIPSLVCSFRATRPNTLVPQSIWRTVEPARALSDSALRYSMNIHLSTPYTRTTTRYTHHGIQLLQQRRTMGFWAELRKSFKAKVEGDKELAETLEQIRTHEGLKKTKDSLSTLQEKSLEGFERVSGTAASAAQASGEKLKEGLSKMSGGVQQTWDTVREKTNLDDTLEKTKQTLDKTKDLIDATSQTVQNSSIYQATTKLSDRVSNTLTDTLKKLPLVEENRSSEPGSSNSTALVVRTDKVSNALNQQLQVVTNTLKKSKAWKVVINTKDRILTSENPLVQRSVEMSESAAYHAKRTAKRLFGESDQARALRVVQTLRPDFVLGKFLQSMKTTTVPKLRKAFLDNDATTLKSILVPSAWAEVQPAVEEADEQGFVSKSLLLDVLEVELGSAILEPESNTPFLQVNCITEESHCLYDSQGKLAFGSKNNITVVHSTIYMSLDETTKEWQVSGQVETMREARSF